MNTNKSEAYMNYSTRDLKRNENKILDTFINVARSILEDVPVTVKTCDH